MRIIQATAALLRTVLGGFMVFDGFRVLTVGDYIRPESGEFAGQLGSWAGVVEAIGIEPLSTGTKSAFVVIGLAWLLAVVRLVARDDRASWRLAAGVAVGSVWYLMIGTTISVVVLALTAVRIRQESHAATR